MSTHRSPKIYELKMTVLGLVFTLVGVMVIALGRWASGLELGSWSWVQALPVGEIGGSLFTIGVVGVAYDTYTRRDKEANSTRRMRKVFRQQAPAMRDAVIQGFAFNKSDLKRVGTPELLDQLTENSLALRFGDDQFAKETYADLLNHAITAEERWHNARVDVSLGIPRGSTCGATSQDLEVLIRWEYTVTPQHRFRRFAVTSDQHRYDELADEAGETSVWFKRQTPGVDICDPELFELVQFSVDGHTHDVERDVTDNAQIYTVDLGERTVEHQQPVVVAFSYRTRTARDGHVLHLDLDRPTRGFHAELTYTDASIVNVRMFDFISTNGRPRTNRDPATASTHTIRYDYDGWVLPRAGLVFIWGDARTPTRTHKKR